MNIYRALLVSKFMPRFFGAAPFALSKSTIETSKFGFFWITVQMSIVAVVFYFFGRLPRLNFTSVNAAIVTAMFWINIFGANYSMMKDGFCQRDLVDFVRAVDYYDEKSGYNNHPRTKHENRIFRFWSFVHLAVVIIVSVRFKVNRNVYMECCIWFLQMQLDSSSFMFVLFVTILGLRFRHLNATIEENRKITVQSSSLASTSAPNTEYVHSMYTHLVTAGAKLNEHYSLTLFVWSTQTTLSSIQLTIGLNKGLSGTSIFEAVDKILRLLTCIRGLIFITVFSQFAVNQANRIATVLLEKSIRRGAQIDRGRKEILAMGMYMALKPFCFTAMGFFNVDMTLISSVVGTVITYIALCIQTDDNNTPAGSNTGTLQKTT